MAVNSSLARPLLGAGAVRTRCAEVFEHVRCGRSAHFQLVEDRLEAVAEVVAGVVAERYPDGNIALHSRWRHFEAGGVDRWRLLQRRRGRPSDVRARAEAEIDLAVVSVLLDAGAGARWRFHDPLSGRDLTRSEGLAVASLLAFDAGVFSADPGQPWRADARALRALVPERLASHFAVDAGHPIPGFAARVALLNRLGAVVEGIAGASQRVSGLFAGLLAPEGGAVRAEQILEVVLTALGEIWPTGLRLGGLPLGDTWRHRAVARDDPTDRLVPFHKLSQWLAYSLVEPLARAGVTVTRLDALTGLAEYRNGGLLVDLGVLEPRAAGAARRRYAVGDELVVEWRACTVCLLDALAPLVARRCLPEGREMALIKLLEGGTWAAGRRVAGERRADAGPPFDVDTGGTVF